MRSEVWCLGRAAGAGARGAPIERTPLVLAHPAPHTGVLTGLQRPGQALADDGAAGAHGLRLGDLSDRRAGRAHGEEQFRIFIAAHRPMASVQRHTPSLVQGSATIVSTYFLLY